MAANMCVAVSKYSHATGVKPDNSIPWIHIVASNIFLVLKGEDTHIRNGQLCLQIVQGNSALETIDVGELVDRAIEAREGSQRAGIMPQIEQLPIFGIHKEVFLALRYRLSDGQARRVQYRLQSAQECASVVETLEQRGMEFQQQRLRTGRPTTARLDTSGSDARPLTTQTSYSANHSYTAPAVPPKQNPFQLQPLEVGGLSSQHPNSVQDRMPLAQPSSRQSSLYQTALTTPSQGPTRSVTNHTMDHSTGTQDLPRSSTTPSRHLLDAVATGHPNLPSQSHMVSTSHHGLDYHVDERLTAQKASHFIDKDQHSGHTPEATLDTALGRSMWPPDQGSVTRGPLDLDRSSPAHRASLHRPSIASLRMPETLEHEMPPRRELPFKRPGSHQSSSSRPSTSSKSVSDSNAAAASSEPTMISSTLSPATKFGTNRPATASSLKRALAPSIAEPVKKARAIEARPQSHASMLPSTSSIKSGPKTTQAAVPGGPFRRPSDLGELLRSTKPNVERSPNSNKVTRLDSTADAAYEVETPPGTATSPTKSSVHGATSSPSRVSSHVASSPNRMSGQQMPISPLPPTGTGNGHVASTSVTEVGATEAASLTDYASQSREDRQTVLDEFMVSKLEDPNFAVLCEDLESCWRRIALGL